jgi:TrmH family RNA methyltransferase
LLDGWHLLHEAANAGLEIATVAVVGTAPSARDADLLDRLSRHTNVFTATAAVMDVMSPTRTPSGVVALARRRHYQFAAALASPLPLLILAADIQDPGNVGAIVRAAEAGGSTGVVLIGHCADPWSWKSLRAAMGSTFRLPVVRIGDAAEAIAQIRSAALALLATVPEGGADMHQVDLRRPVAIMLGGEGAGLTERLWQAADELITIPMRPPVQSLNVAVAAALLVYEARRQREV